MPRIDDKSPSDIGGRTRSNNYFERRYVAMDEEFRLLEPEFKAARNLCAPERGKFDGDHKTTAKERRTKILNNIAERAVEVAVNGLMAGTTNPSIPWFALQSPEKNLQDERDVGVFMDTTRDDILRTYGKSNYYIESADQKEEALVFGTGVKFTWAQSEKLQRCETLTMGEYRIAQNNEGDIDTIYREVTLTLRELFQEFGEDNPFIPEKFHQLKKTGLDSVEVTLLHAVEPNSDNIPKGARPVFDFAWVSVYYLRPAHRVKGSGRVDHENQDGVYLRASGFREKPFSVLRWKKRPNSPWGTGPGLKVLPEIRSLQFQERVVETVSDEHARPQLQGHSSLRSTLDIDRSEKIVYYEGPEDGQGLTALHKVRTDAQLSLLQIERLERRINEFFHVDLFKLLMNDQDRTKTAEETARMDSEKFAQLATVLQHMNAGNDDDINRTFDLMFDAGFVTDIPEPLQAVGRFDVEYISAISLAQRAVEVTNIEAKTGFITQLAQATGMTELIQRPNWDAIIKDYDDLMGGRENHMKSDAEYEQRLKELAQQQQAEAMQERAQSSAASAKDLAAADLGNGQNALSLALSRMGIS